MGLFALYRWTADAYGDYAGLSVVGVILVVAAAVLIAVTAAKAKSLKAVEMKPRDVAATTEAVLDTPLLRTSGSDPHASEARTHSWTRPDTATLPDASASDLVDPLAFFLSKYVRFPTVGNPVVDELIGNLRATAHGSTDEAIDRAAEVIRHGNRSSLVFVLTGTAFLAWLLTQNSRR